MLLHTVIDSDSASASNNTQDNPNEILPTVIEFLDHFEASLEVVVGCARKTEPTRWKQLFEVVGNPKTLFEVSFIIEASRSFQFIYLH